MTDKKKELIERIIANAKFKGSMLWSNGNGIMYAERGKEIPKQYLPGAFIESLSEEDRKILLTCTETDFQSLDWRPEDYKKYRDNLIK